VKNKIILGLASLLAIAAVYALFPQGPAQRVREKSSIASSPVATPSGIPTPKREPAAAPHTPAKISSITGPEVQSLDSLGHTLSQVGQPAFTLKGLLEDLQKSGQQPLVVRDNNPDSGEMLIVRTKSPLPGTRYFHAQYFTDEDGSRFVQHMSFEFKPGPDAMAAAVATVERNFPNLSRPVVQKPDYVKWILDNHYIVWVKKMAEADLQDDPFNSYSVSDNGTIRVAVELEIHGD